MKRQDRKLTVATYARVSSADQKGDLETQSLKLQNYVDQHYGNAAKIHITDLGSGLNYRKKGLNQLLKLIWHRQIDVLVLNHRDRLLRFGAELVYKLCSFCNVDVVVVENESRKNYIRAGTDLGCDRTDDLILREVIWEKIAQK